MAISILQLQLSFHTIYTVQQSLRGFVPWLIRRGAKRVIYGAPSDGSAPRDHEPRRLASRRSAAGMSRRRFDLKVEWDISRHSFDILFSDDLRQTSPAIPTCGSRQAPCHESRLKRLTKTPTRAPLRGSLRLPDASRGRISWTSRKWGMLLFVYRVGGFRDAGI